MADSSLLALAMAAGRMEEEAAMDSNASQPAEPNSYSRKTRPTHSAFQKAVMAHCMSRVFFKSEPRG